MTEQQRTSNPVPERKHTVYTLFLLLAAALLLRLVVFLCYPSMYWPDEVYQTREAAHRLAFGIGVIPWEFRLGMRSWVLPGVIAAIMKCTSWIAPGSSGYNFGIAFFFSLLSLTVVWFAYSWCREYFGLAYANVAAFSAAIWFELVNFGARSLTEVIAGNLFLPAIYLGFCAVDRKPGKKWLLFSVGVLLGLTVSLRVQFGPAVLLVGLWIMSRDWRRRFVPVALGGFLVVALFGIVDAITWSYPFYSYYSYFRENILHHHAADFGVLPWYYYLLSLFTHTGPLPLFALLGARRSPVLGWICLAVLLPHMLLSHKEFRFIYPVLPLLLILASIGILDLLRAFQLKAGWLRSPWATQLVAACFFLLCSVVLAARFPRWDNARGALRAFSRLAEDPKACGVAVTNMSWVDPGGYTYLHRPIPVFFYRNSSNEKLDPQSFNRIVTRASVPVEAQGFSPSICKDGVCIFSRDGDCRPGDSGHEINAYLKRIGE